MALYDDAPNLFGRGATAALPSFREVFTAFLDLNVTQVATLAGASLWLVILALPLTGIDRRDRITAATYSAFLLASGIALLVVIPHWRTTRGYAGGIASSTAQIWASVAMIAASAYRWRGRRHRDFAAISVEDAERAAPKRRAIPKGDVYE